MVLSPEAIYTRSAGKTICVSAVPWFCLRWKDEYDYRQQQGHRQGLEQHLAGLAANLGQHFSVVNGLFSCVHIAQTAPGKPQSGLLAPLEDAGHAAVE